MSVSDALDFHRTNARTTDQQILCVFHSFDVPGFRQAQTMVFAINEINRNSNLLPNITLGYSLYDNCLKLAVGFRAALSLVSGSEQHFLLEDTCEGSPPVMGIVGDSSSTRSIAISSVLGLYRIPMVSFRTRYAFEKCENLIHRNVCTFKSHCEKEKKPVMPPVSSAGELLCHMFLPERAAEISILFQNDSK